MLVKCLRKSLNVSFIALIPKIPGALSLRFPANKPCGRYLQDYC
jgi:hypothetical protein